MNTLLKEISEWKLAAQREDNSRYFFHTAELDEIRKGKKLYVIGRKGSGKTAISENFRLLAAYNVFSEMLSFKSFPFNELYDKHDDKFKRPSQFITIWKFITYMCICKMMSRNAKIDVRARDALQKLYPTDPVKRLSKLIPRWVGQSFEVSAFTVGGKISLGTPTENIVSWIDKTEILEDFILRYADEATYFILFDELDEDYADVIERSQSNEYLDLIFSLFKAVEDVAAIFPRPKYAINPVIFLRDDIYSLLKNTDKAKWSDSKIDLQWDEDRIKNLLAFRISRSISSTHEILSFPQAWDKVFVPKGVPVGGGQRRSMSIFKYITRSTLIRPRDYIQYLKLCAQRELDRGNNLIDPLTVRGEDRAFSNYLRTEFLGEIEGLMPEIKAILQIISHMGLQTFDVPTFTDAFVYYNKLKPIEAWNAESALQVLFHFSVIGNIGLQKKVHIFKYTNQEATFNSKERVVVHRGLFKALQII